MTIRIYLAWQRIADGRAQIRRWSPDRASPLGKCQPHFLGFERQASDSLAWLTAHGEPTWPECLAAALPAEPFSSSEDGFEYKAWESKDGAIKATNSPALHEQWIGRAKRVVTGNEPLEMTGVVVNEAATVDEAALAGAMRTLKQHKGEK